MCLQYDNNIWPRLIMIIIKISILYFIQITHTDDFPSTGTQLSNLLFMVSVYNISHVTLMTLLLCMIIHVSELIINLLMTCHILSLIVINDTLKTVVHIYDNTPYSRRGHVQSYARLGWQLRATLRKSLVNSSNELMFTIMCIRRKIKRIVLYRDVTFCYFTLRHLLHDALFTKTRLGRQALALFGRVNFKIFFPFAS